MLKPQPCISILILCLLFQVGLASQEATAWNFKGEKDGIKIYHQKTAELLHIKLETTVKAPLSGIAALFSDVEQYKTWGYKILESRLLQRTSPFEVWYYALYDFPWPMEDRDIILQSKMQQDPITRRISITNTPHPAYLPKKKGVFRINNTTTRWSFSQGEGGWVYVEQQISTDSAEGLPDWLVEMTVDTAPRETARNIRKILQQEKYQNARLPHILDR